MKWTQPIRMFTLIFSLAAVLSACGGGAKEAASQEPAQEAGAELTADSTQTSGADPAAEESESNASEPASAGTESTLKELQEEYADKLGYIRIPLDDDPVRRVSEEGSKNINVANYSDTVVDMNAEVPIHANTQRLIDDAFPFFTTVQAPDVTYITWDEATNLERAMVKTLFISREGLLITEDAMNNKDYSSQSFQDSMDFFRVTAKFESMAPVAQHPYDITLSELYDKARKSWGELAVMDPEQDEAAFAEKYQTARTDANNAMGLLNILLSTNEEERMEQTYGK
ncbi:hypothetical protein [Paenibacillus illinoisensis]|uniref:Lipoprotein n=1 Tax=Paenibacillus illinoisensis TaxID=59845 RepID=A0A2W0CGC7_9BACL|nr:hypothetical protein [Paenibacillus illinoisensis]PYY31287.1 Uncharacterized protein PIL02S_00378 [Paenibacillus illinoisensis]